MAERPVLTPARLQLLLDKLDDVMAEASRLRREVTRQLDEQRRKIQPNVTPARKRATRRR